jgi:hypothetical protein
MKTRAICKKLLPMVALFIIFVIIAGCSGKKKQAASQAGSPSKTNSAKPADKSSTAKKFPVEGMTNISDNPGFFKAENKAAATEATARLDRVLRAKFKKVFSDVKLISDTGPDPDRPGKADVLNCLTYVPRRLMDHKDADDLHTMLTTETDPHFSTSPRYGSKPVHGGVFVMMSLTTVIDSVPYSLGIRMDLENQIIGVDSFQVGTKYDRL